MSEITERLDRIEAMIRKLVEQTSPAAGELVASSRVESFYSVAEVSERFGVSTGTVRNLVRTGKLPASRIGKGRGTLRFDPAQLRQFQLESAGALIRRRGR